MNLSSVGVTVPNMLILCDVTEARPKVKQKKQKRFRFELSIPRYYAGLLNVGCRHPVWKLEATDALFYWY